MTEPSTALPDRTQVNPLAKSALLADGPARPGPGQGEAGASLAVRSRSPATWFPTPPAATPDHQAADPPGPLEREDRFINRELSWLEFGARLLELASDDRIPLFERVKFLAIFSEGVDEFFQVRVAGLEDQIAANLRTRSPDGLSPRDQLDAITTRATQLLHRQSAIFSDQVAPALAASGVVVADWHTLGEADRTHLSEVFNRSVFPVLTPLAVDHGHPFPYISDLSLNLVVRVQNPTSGEQRIARVKVPPVVPRFVPLPDNRRFVPVEQLIAAHLETLFPTMSITEHHVFRVTRNADLSVEEDEAEDLLAAVELELHRRRFGQAVRLEASADISSDLLDMLIAEVDVPEDNVYLSDVPLDLSGLRALTRAERPELSAPRWAPVAAAPLATGADIFSVLTEHDVLVHHPYESFATSVEAFVAEAANDDDVLAIKQTLYRTGNNSPVVASLIRASQAGKQVTAVIELQARFDEQANIARARALEEAGVQVLYGLAALKTHAKISLVVRREAGDVRRYCHIGSGNYNSQTAREYEDVGMFTADADIGADVGELFNLLTGLGHPPAFRRLVVSPASTRAYLMKAIEEQARSGDRGRIVIKTNGLTDPAVIDAFYRASSAGVSIDLIVRGRCCLRPGVPGLSENIRVRSIVGRYLEHSRLFCFGGGDGHPPQVSMGSPDLMERNLERRVEVIVPVDDPHIRSRMVDILDQALRDQANSWELGPDGQWARVGSSGTPDDRGFNLQDHFQDQALASLRLRRDTSVSTSSSPVASPAAASPAAPAPTSPPVRHQAPSPLPPVKPTPPRWWHRLFRRRR